MRVAIFLPGRGSYTEKSLGALPLDHEWVRTADALRAELDLPPVSALDAAKRFEPAKHLKPSNVSALIFLVSMLDGIAASKRDRVVCIGGNSMGWYTALALAGALDFEDGFRLVQEMALLQEQGEGGGQVIYPVVDESWRPAPDAAAAVNHLLADGKGEIFPSIHLGGYEVLAGSSKGVARLLKKLPPVELGRTKYPFRLALHGPYHTPLSTPVAQRATEILSGLAFRRPHTTLIDGRGRTHTPWDADPDELRAYTLGAQVDTPYDFTASVRVGLCEFAPERIVLPGPGNTLGGICGQVAIGLGWRGMRSREAFTLVQESDAPLLDSMRR